MEAIGGNKKIDPHSLARTAGRGALWQVIGGGWQVLIRLGASTILARLLTPDDFGIVALSIMLYGLFSQVSVLSSTTGILSKSEVSSEDLNTSFWMGACIQLLLFLLVNISAPLLGTLFSDGRLIKVIHAHSLLFLFAVIGSLPLALMRKRLLFLHIVCVNAIAVVFEMGFAIFLVKFFNMGYWSLVWAMVASNFGMNLAYLFLGGWLPKLQFSKTSFYYLIRYGLSGLITNGCIYIRQNIDYLVIGKFLGSHFLGLYSFAYKIPDIILKRIAMPASSVVLPTASHFQEKNELIIKAYIKASQYLSLLTFPILSGLGFLAKPLVQLLWGEQWLSCVTPLRIICIATAVSCVAVSIGSVFLCKNRPTLIAKLVTFDMVYSIMWVIPLTVIYGLSGAATGMLLSKTSFAVSVYFAFKLTRSSPLLLIRKIAPAFIASTFCGVFSNICYQLLTNTGIHLLANISLSILCGGFIYLFILRSCFYNLWMECLNISASLLPDYKKSVCQ